MRNSKFLYWVLTIIYIIIFVASGTIMIIFMIQTYKFLLFLLKDKGLLGTIIASLIVVLLWPVVEFLYLCIMTKISNFIDKFK